MKKILFVEDDYDYRMTLAKIIEKAGYSVDASEDPLQAIELFALNSYDLVISDLKMDSLDGIRFLQYIKNKNADVKTMILTSAPTFETELEALDISIDKYMVKETRIDLLLKYIEVLLAQSGNSSRKHQIVHSPFENIELDLGSRVIRKEGETINVTPKEFNILRVLMQNRGLAVSREKLLEEVWDVEHELIDPRVIDVHIKEIRKKLAVQSIVSIRGYGYKWDE